MCEELRALQTQAHAQLREETSRRCSLLQEEVQGAALNVQQLLLKLQQAEDQVRVRPVTWFFSCSPEPSRLKCFIIFKLLNVEKQQLEKDQLQVHGRLSSHKEATQLLQTELQDSRAQVQDQDKTIQTLQNQLKQAQVGFSDHQTSCKNILQVLFN